MIKVGINGFGRIGRAIYRINQKKQLFDVKVINDINSDVQNISYLLQYDTTYGKMTEKVTSNLKQIFVGEKKMDVYHQENIIDVPWDDYDVDIVIDSSGIKNNLMQMINSTINVKHFIVTNAPQGHEEIKTIIFGVNEHEIDVDKQKVFSASICDTVALSPIIKMISESHKIESGFLTTLHPWLSYQNLLDGPSKSWSQPGDVYSHYSLGRASTENIIPKSTSAILAADMVFPGISNIIQSFSFRTPNKIVSGAVLILLLSESLSCDVLKRKFYNLEETQTIKVFHNSVEPLTSLDYAGEEYSAIIDHRWTKIENGRHLKLVYWYDNEWGYSSRVIDLVKAIMDCIKREE